MAPTKRKGDAPEGADGKHARKKARILTDDQSKDRKTSRTSALPKTAGTKKRTSSDTGDSATQPLNASVFGDEEPSFPRGGGSVLTPIEKKQIQAQAHRDVLFEQQGLDNHADAFNSGEENTEEVGKGSGSVQKTKSRKLGKKRAAPQPELASVRVEGLNYKRIVAGSMILGQVSSINAREVIVALPNNLTGYIALTAVSDVLTEKIETLLNEQDEISEDQDSSLDDDDIDLEQYFYVGQFLRTYVTSTNEENGDVSVAPRKRIELSVNPRLANEGLNKGALIVNSMVQASVSSVEDHGVIVDLGIPGTKGFVPSTSLGADLPIMGIKGGSVMLCIVTGHGSSGNVVKLLADLQRAGNLKKTNYLSTGPTISPFLPGVAAEITLSEVNPSGLVGKIMGMLDVTADLFHSAARGSKADLTEKYEVGQKIKGRIICTFPTSNSRKLGFSLLEHVISFSSSPFLGPHNAEALSEMPSISTIVPKAKIVKVEPNVGLFLEIGAALPRGFVHISRVSDGKVEYLSASAGAYKIGSEHEARIIGQNSMDGLFILSMERKVIEQPFLRIEEVKVGEVLKGTIEKLLIGPNGVDGIIVTIADHITGLVPAMHIADTQLKHLEKKYREGMTVKLRVLSTNPEKSQLRFTLKKSLVNSEADIWNDYTNIASGKQSQGTLISVKPQGAVVQFYGAVKGFLPVAEMSEAYIKDATEHFRVGQVVNVSALRVDAALSRLTLSCKDPSSFTKAHREAFEKLQPGALVSGSVFEKSNDDLLLNLDSGLVARLELEHLGDKTSQKNSTRLKDIRVGQKLHDLLVLEKQKNRHLILLSSKPSLVNAAKEGSLLKSFEDVKEGRRVAGFVKNMSSDGIFVGFVGGLTGLIPKSHIPDDTVKLLPDFDLRRSQSLAATVLLVDQSQQRFYLTMKPLKELKSSPEESRSGEKSKEFVLEDAVDGITISLQDFTLGKLTQAKITSVKQTQINVILAKNVQGRIHVSEVFDHWEDIKDKKRPLSQFESGQIIDVRVLGIHDARNHRFLPLTSKAGKNPVFELSARTTMIESPEKQSLTLENVETGSTWTCFVNNVEADCIWVNLSPLVRGLVRAFDASDDLSLLSDLDSNFPTGSAIKATVTNVKVDTNKLTLSAKGEGSTAPLQLGDLSRGTILPGKVTKIMEKQILVQLSDSIMGAVHLIDMADDFAEANTAAYERSEVIRVSVVQVDTPNKRVMLSTRPSKILSSSLEIKDPEILSVEQLKPNDIVRGFVQHVADSGIFITLGHKVTSYVRVTNLSDSYLKEWKDNFQVNHLVQGKIISVDKDTNKVQMSLKASVMDPNYVPPIAFNDLKVGQIVTGKVAKVEEFGVFILVDGSANVRGLCHRSEIADQKVEDATKLYKEGDAVKAKILKLDEAKRRVNFGLKASYFQEDLEMDSDSELDDGETGDEIEGVQLVSESDEQDADSEEDDSSAGGVDIEPSEEGSDAEMEDASLKPTGVGLSVRFDWTGKAEDDASGKSEVSSDEDRTTAQPAKKRRKKAEIKVDRTGDLDAHGPQSAADFERLLLGEPDSSFLWVSYMAFQLELSEVDKARGIAERALKTMDISQEAEKLNVWVALLNLENTYGEDESVDETFRRACQYNDAQDIHEKFASICIGSGKIEKADSTFQALAKRFSQDPKVWTNYAHFLFNTASAPDRGRALLPRALQSLPSSTHVDLTSKFGQLEFSSEHGDPERGRTIFEGLLSSFPKRVDLWNVLIDCEIKGGDREAVRALFDRLTMGEKLKPKKAKFFFKKWLAFEEQVGDEEMAEMVKGKAEEFVRAQREQSE